MDDEAAIGRLPRTHASALRLRDRGFDDEAIAKALGLEPGAVAPLLTIADAKVAALTRPRTSTGAQPPRAGV
jgi:DNA-directed RNA polymerase specialized sigma24 family protein